MSHIYPFIGIFTMFCTVYFRATPIIIRVLGSAPQITATTLSSDLCGVTMDFDMNPSHSESGDSCRRSTSDGCCEELFDSATAASFGDGELIISFNSYTIRKSDNCNWFTTCDACNEKYFHSLITICLSR